MKHCKWINNPDIMLLFDAIPYSSKYMRFVGGCVRDMLAGQSTEKDIDIATIYHPKDIVKFLKENGIKFSSDYKKYGIIVAIIADNRYEIATLRNDIFPDGRHTQISFTDSWYEDSKRRDFTFNAVYMDINGNITDYWNGVKDINDGMISFIGEPSIRIREDYLRVLRFFRFYSCYGKKYPVVNILSAIKDNSHGLTILSGERVQEELLKLFDTQNIIDTLKIMETTNVFKSIFSENIVLSYKNLITLLDYDKNISSLIKLIATFGPNRCNIDTVVYRLKFPKNTKLWINNILKLVEEFKSEPLVVHLHYHRKENTLIAYILYSIFHADTISIEIINMINIWIYKKYPVSGLDLIHNGIPQGPILGKILKTLEYQWVLAGRPIID